MQELFARMFIKIKKEFFTIPNILSMVRILLIPVIVYLYCFEKNYIWTFIVVAFSSLTDIVDGFIARRFNMITDFGKLIDPVADKGTQLAVFACLSTRFPLMLVPFAIMLIKELGSLILRVIVFKETDVVDGAKWHGKTSTTIIIIVIAIHLLWINIPSAVSFALIAASTLFMIYSGVMYTVESFKMLKTYGRKI